MKMHRRFFAAGWIAAVCFAALGWIPAVTAQDMTPTKTVITVLPKHTEMPPTITPQDVKIKVNGKAVRAESITPLRADRAGLELVILIDSGARTSLGIQLRDLTNFIQSLPPTTEVGIAYMMNGQAVFEQPFTADKARAANALHLPAGSAGSSASPYFCLSDLAKNWPSRNPKNRREVIAITDGIDPYEVRFDPSDPYAQAAIRDSIRAGVIVNALYWHNRGIASRVGWAATGGQNLLNLVTEKTGGKLYYQGLGNPVSFAPFLKEISKRLNNQYELGFSVPPRVKPGIDGLKVKLEVPDVKLTAPDLVLVPAR
jgi:hypothetical protein